MKEFIIHKVDKEDSICIFCEGRRNLALFEFDFGHIFCICKACFEEMEKYFSEHDRKDVNWQ